MQRRIWHFDMKDKSKKGASGYPLSTLLAELKSGQFICSKRGPFYLLTTDFSPGVRSALTKAFFSCESNRLVNFLIPHGRYV